jgi:two-component system sensor histidine kinase KdpD
MTKDERRRFGHSSFVIRRPGKLMADNYSEDERRPSPDALLAALEQEQERRGRLKIFLGAAPGVGKTYAMLEAAQARKRDGVDVVIGVVETHGRAETEALLSGLEAIARRQVEHRGRVLYEMDLDTVLARKPQLVLVDELAHTNVPGSRHPKRYLDVEELLAAGIDVYTTVNIQHLESLNDAVAQITGIQVRETIPDSIFERADEVELIDLSPEQLLQRLREGKVYIPDQAERAIHNYFRPGNLTALRQLALRRTAERVDEQMQTYMHAHAIPGPWPAVERIMVCVSANPLSLRLIRTARRMADRRHAEWLAVYVETPQHIHLSEAERDRIAAMLRLAEQLRGEGVTISGDDVADELVRYARSRNVTELIVGKPRRSRWHEVWRGSIVNNVIRKSGDIDVYVISGEEAPERAPVLLPPSPLDRTLNSYFYSGLAVAAAGLVAWVLQSFLAVPNLALIFLTAVLFSAVTQGLWPSIFASVLSALVYNFFFTEPYLTFYVASPQDILTLVMFLAVAILTSNLAGRVRDYAEAARQREARTAALYAMSRAIAGAAQLDDVLQAIVKQLTETLVASAVVLLPESGQLTLKPSSPPGIELSEAERAPATWAWEHNQPAGRGTDTLAGTDWLYVPLRTVRCVVGVLGVRFALPGAVLSPDQRRLLEALADQAAIAIERAHLVQNVEQTRVLTETERLRAALLSSISHDLRTPLASIVGAVSGLLADDGVYDEAGRHDLLLTIQEEANRLNRFVANLLDMTRLESGALELNRAWVEIGDVIGAALARLAEPLSGHRLVVNVARDVPLLCLDFVLVEQVFANLLENAAEYSAPGSTIRVDAWRDESSVVVEVVDEGVGVPPGDLERIFDKFYRVRAGDRQSASTGLGLSICRGIIEAHGGTISARSPANGVGTVFTVKLPVEEEPSVPMEREVEHEPPGTRL